MVLEDVTITLQSKILSKAMITLYIFTMLFPWPEETNTEENVLPSDLASSKVDRASSSSHYTVADTSLY